MDHIKLAKERYRMCEAHKAECSTRCPLFLIAERYHDEYDISRAPACRLACMYEPEKATEIISKWSAENPEPRLPTWREWFLSFLPEVPIAIAINLHNHDLGLDLDLYLRNVHSHIRIDVRIKGMMKCECDIDDTILADIAEMLKVPMIAPEGVDQ